MFLMLLVPEIFHEGQRKKNAVDSQDNAMQIENGRVLTEM